MEKHLNILEMMLSLFKILLIGGKMGIKDLVPLHAIYDEIKSLEKEFKWGFDFKVDNGSFETAIEFRDAWKNHQEEYIQCWHPPMSRSWDEAKESGTVIRCPDLLDWHHKLIIEYEEAPGPRRSGAKLAKKGHGLEGDLTNDRDKWRDTYYRLTGFTILKIYQLNYEDDSYKFIIKDWLLKQFVKTIPNFGKKAE